jgi:tetratricopeptide (TPR) repeat protein
VPLSGVTAMLHVLCGVREGSAIEEVRAIEPDLRSLGLVDVEIEAILAQLGAPISPSQGGGAPALRPALLRMMTSLASRNVQLYVWDDAQSLDAASQKLLIEIMRRLRATRTVFLFAARSANDISWLSEHDTMQLEPLPPRDAERLLALRLGVRSVPPELVAFCTKRAGEQAGLPLFLEELAHEMRESGAVVVKGVEVEQLRLDGALAVPRPLRSLIAARIARLDAEAQLALSAAAVLGEPIEVAPLAVMLQTSTHDIDRALATLEERACVRRTGPTTFTFTTPLLLDVVTGSLTADVQREWHGRAAVALEELLGARADEQAHRIAAHWVDGGQREKASVFFARSAARRLATRQFEAAAAEATRALELIELDQLSVNDALALIRTLAAAVSRTRVSPAAPGLLERLVAHVDASGNTDEQAMIRIEAARILGAISQIDPALELLSAVHERSANAPSIAQQARLVESDLYFRKGDFNRCMLVLEDARSRGLPREQDERVLMILSQVYAALGDRDQAMSHLAQIDALASDDPTVLADRAKAHGLVHAFLREFPQAKVHMEDAVARARGANLPLEVAVNQHNLGDSNIRLGDHSRAYAVLLQSLEVCEQNSADRLASNNRVYLAYLDGLQGAPDAESRIREGIQYADGHGWTWDVVDGRYFLGRILDRRGREDDALVELKQCRDIARSVHFKLLEDDCTVAIDEIESRERNTLIPPPAVG